MLPSSPHVLLLLLLAPSAHSLPPDGGWGPVSSVAHTVHHVWVPMESTRKKGGVSVAECAGMDNLVHDLTVLSLFTGVVGTALSIFTASYTSVLSNTISALSALFSLLLGIPAAVLTYLAASDRLSYTAGNVLSVLSFMNTAYGALSIDFGNKDIFTSQLANVIGVFSLALSVLTAFPQALLPPTISSIASAFNTHPAPLHAFVRNYGCYGAPTIYDLIDNFLRSQ